MGFIIYVEAKYMTTTPQRLGGEKWEDRNGCILFTVLILSMWSNMTSLFKVTCTEVKDVYNKWSDGSVG